MNPSIVVGGSSIVTMNNAVVAANNVEGCHHPMSLLPLIPIFLLAIAGLFFGIYAMRISLEDRFLDEDDIMGIFAALVFIAAGAFAAYFGVTALLS